MFIFCGKFLEELGPTPTIGFNVKIIAKAVGKRYFFYIELDDFVGKGFFRKSEKSDDLSTCRRASGPQSPEQRSRIVEVFHLLSA